VTERRHPDTALTGYVTGALAPAERAQVDAHLGGCVDCRRAVEESRAVLDALATSVAEPPALDWGRYRADLRARVERAPRRAWWARPLPAIIAAGVATAAVVLAVHGLDRRPAELATVEETVLGARLPLLQQYRVVERLDMLEDLDAIRQLDRFGHGGS
jgi:anti-sigma factor RsiW